MVQSIVTGYILEVSAMGIPFGIGLLIMLVAFILTKNVD